jgi:hypothetical protein
MEFEQSFKESTTDLMKLMSNLMRLSPTERLFRLGVYHSYLKTVLDSLVDALPPDQAGELRQRLKSMERSWVASVSKGSKKFEPLLNHLRNRIKGMN